MLVEIAFYILLASLFIQLFYAFFFFLRIVFHKEKKTTHLPPTSIIIACHNEAANLPLLIAALVRQTHTDFEVIFANDRSTDQSEKLLKEASERNPNFKAIHIKETPKGFHPKKYVLAQAIALAKNKILLFTDADCIPHKNWAKEMTSHYLQNTEIVLGFSPYQKKKGILNVFIRHETFYTGLQYLSFALAGMPYMAVGRNLSYTKEVFERNNGFGKYQGITGGDDDLLINQQATKLNTAIAIHPKTQVYSIPEITFNRWFRQKKRHLSVGKHYKKRDILLLGVLNLSHICFYLSLMFLWVEFPEKWILLKFYASRVIPLWFVFGLIKRKLSDNFNLYLFPITDFLYVCYYLVIGMVSMFTKKIKWK